MGEMAAWGVASLLFAAGLSLRWLHQVRAFVWSGGLPGGRGALPVIDVPADEAPRGWKCAQVLLHPVTGEIHLAGVALGGLYEVDDAAVCAFGRGHESPDLGCDCGFYAFIERARAVDLVARAAGPGAGTVVRALCEVDLAGTVIECDDGYRAGRQRVLGVRLLPWCAACARRGDLVHAERLAAYRSAREPGAGDLRGYATMASRRSIHDTVRARLERVPMHPICGSCGERAEERSTLLELTEVANRLGTEVGWLPTETVPVTRVLRVHRPRPPWAM